MKDLVPLCRGGFNPCIPHTEQRQGKSSAYGTADFPLSVSAIRTRQETRRLPPQTARRRHLRAFFTKAGSAAFHHLPAGELRTERHTRPSSADHGSPEGEAQRYFSELTLGISSLHLTTAQPATRREDRRCRCKRGREIAGRSWSSEWFGSKSVDQMLEALHVPFEHIAGTWRAGHSEPLVLHHERLFKSMDDRGVHASFDGALPRMFTRYLTPLNSNRKIRPGDHAQRSHNTDC